MSAESPNKTADPAGYEDWYLRYLTLKRATRHLAHRHHEPDPTHWGLTERDAAFIRVRVEREYNRKF